MYTITMSIDLSPTYSHTFTGDMFQIHFYPEKNKLNFHCAYRLLIIYPFGRNWTPDHNNTALTYLFLLFFYIKYYTVYIILYNNGRIGHHAVYYYILRVRIYNINTVRFVLSCLNRRKEEKKRSLQRGRNPWRSKALHPDNG